MSDLDKRVDRLERASGQGEWISPVVIIRQGETLEDAMIRLGFPVDYDGAVICLPETVRPSGLVILEEVDRIPEEADGGEADNAG